MTSNSITYIPSETVTVVYIHSHAFTKCECGKEMGLVQRSYGVSTYTGSCDCGLHWKLKDKVLFKVSQ